MTIGFDPDEYMPPGSKVVYAEEHEKVLAQLAEAREHVRVLRAHLQDLKQDYRYEASSERRMEVINGINQTLKATAPKERQTP